MNTTSTTMLAVLLILVAVAAVIAVVVYRKRQSLRLKKRFGDDGARLPDGGL